MGDKRSIYYKLYGSSPGGLNTTDFYGMGSQLDSGQVKSVCNGAVTLMRGWLHQNLWCKLVVSTRLRWIKRIVLWFPVYHRATKWKLQPSFSSTTICVTTSGDIDNRCNCFIGTFGTDPVGRTFCYLFYASSWQWRHHLVLIVICFICPDPD